MKLNTNLEQKVYEVAIELKEIFTNLYYEEDSETFEEYLLDNNFPKIVEYINYLIENGKLSNELEEPANCFLHLAIDDLNDCAHNRAYLYGQGIEYYPDYRYSIPSTRDVIDAIDHLYLADEPLGYIQTYEDYLHQLETEGKTVSDDFKAGYYKAIQLYVE